VRMDRNEMSEEWPSCEAFVIGAHVARERSKHSEYDAVPKRCKFAKEMGRRFFACACEPCVVGTCGWEEWKWKHHS
jgi:hypothetical protein